MYLERFHLPEQAHCQRAELDTNSVLSAIWYTNYLRNEPLHPPRAVFLVEHGFYVRAILWVNIFPEMRPSANPIVPTSMLYTGCKALQASQSCTAENGRLTTQNQQVKIQFQAVTSYGQAGRIKTISPFCQHHCSKALWRQGDSANPPTRITRQFKGRISF